MSSFYGGQYNKKLELSEGVRRIEQTTPTFGQTVDAGFSNLRLEGLSRSQDMNERPAYGDRQEKLLEVYNVASLQDLDPDYHGMDGYYRNLPSEEQRKYNDGLINNGDVFLDDNLKMVAATEAGRRMYFSKGTEGRDSLYEALLIRRASVEFPDIIETDKKMLGRLSEGLAEKRRKNQSIMQRGSGLASMAGTAGAAFTDPAVAATMLLGYGWLKPAAGIGTNIVKGVLTEGAIAGVSETYIQTEVFDYKRSIDSPYTKADALATVLAVSLGAGVVRGAASGLIDTGVYAAKGFERGTGSYTAIKEILQNEQMVKQLAKSGVDPLRLKEVTEEITRRNVSKPATTGTKEHSEAVDVSRAQAEDQAPINVEAIVPSEQVLPGGRLATNKTLEEFDPAKLETDAKLMQYKAGGDAEGVTDALTSVSRFDRSKAGIITVYERTDGTLIVADGHQRLGLAKRALAAGQDPADVVLQGFRLREATGVTPKDARVEAAMINIADDKGTAIDAAKVLREVTDQETLDLLEATITKKSVAYTQGQSLAKLEGDAFGLVANGDVKPSYAAIVGDLISGEAQQLKALDVLRKTDPSNIDEARSIVNQVKALGFTQGKTTDLFGDVDIANNLFIERAQLIGAMMARLKKEKATFNQLLERETTITGKGNKLDQEANLEAKTDAENVLNQIERLANTTGPVSEAITRGAQRIADGEKPNTVVGGVIKDVSRGLENVSRKIDGDNGPGGVNRGAEPAEGRAVEEALPDHYKSGEAFRDHWKAKGVDNGVKVSKDGKYIRPNKIVIEKSGRKQGQGTQFMEDLIRFADSKGLDIRIAPSKDFGATSVKRLIKFYKRFGFVENKGKNKDFEIDPTMSMYRKPEKGRAVDSFADEVKGKPGEPTKRVNEERAKRKSNPVKVYHSTGDDFNEFDSDRAIAGQTWFTSNKAKADEGYDGSAGQGRTVDARVDIRNPAGYDEYEKYGIGELIGQGYDGLKLVEADEVVYVAFFPEQIKIISNRIVGEQDEIIPKTGEKSMDAPGSYRMEHEAPEPEPGASLDDVSNIYPDDIYSPDAARLYGSNGDDISRESAEIIKQARGNPDSIVTVYRAIPEGMDEINPGDWVSISKKYAEDHGVRSVGEPGGGGHVVVSREVRAGDIYTEGNSLHEWSWAPPVREAGEVVDTASKTVLPSKKLTVRVNRRAVDVLQNPTMGQRQQFTASIRAEMKADGVVNPDLLPLTRSTQDELGNTWLWDSSATMHTWMEAELEKLGHKNLSQNGANNAALKVQEAERLAEKTQGVVGAARLAEAAKDTGNEALDPANNVDLFDAARARMDMEDMEVSAGYRDDGTEILKSARQYAKELDEEMDGLKALEACIKG